MYLSPWKTIREGDSPEWRLERDVLFNRDSSVVAHLRVSVNSGGLHGKPSYRPSLVDFAGNLIAYYVAADNEEQAKLEAMGLLRSYCQYIPSASVEVEGLSACPLRRRDLSVCLEIFRTGTVTRSEDLIQEITKTGLYHDNMFVHDIASIFCAWAGRNKLVHFNLEKKPMSLTELGYKVADEFRC